MPDATARILVDDAHQLGNGGAPVALHMPRYPARGGGELAIDHQQPVVVAAQHGLDHHGRSFGVSGLEGGGDAVLAGDVDGDAPAVIAVERLDDDGIADSFGRPHRLIHAVDQALLRHGQTEVGEDAVGEILVRRDFNGDMRGLRRQRRLDPLLVLALADLDQAGVVEPVDRNVAGLGRTHQFHGRGPQGTPFGIVQEIIDVLVEIGRPLLGILEVSGDGGEHVTGDFAGLDTDVLVAVAVEHLDDIRIAGRPRPRQRAVDAGGMLKRQSQLSDQIADGQRLAGAQCGKQLGLFTGKPRQHRCQRVDHARPQSLEGFGITRPDVHLEADDGLACVDVRADIHRKGIDIHRSILITRRTCAHQNAVGLSAAPKPWTVFQHAGRSSAGRKHHKNAAFYECGRSRSGCSGGWRIVASAGGEPCRNNGPRCDSAHRTRGIYALLTGGYRRLPIGRRCAPARWRVR